eukprot:CAMPEP_0177645544 /NCGR_PEP_ID=MMETSP0447-20121125/9306_1 /TAXON_ID=0 /ORGANISM="Stygamoeba regulata, Strain BSH-02190019" /LENGTH=376 /DNA_ID=CAMNT_0019148035 /DNA_START=359 /DNA_END=1489 /DNA_ORIENTATION=-
MAVNGHVIQDNDLFTLTLVRDENGSCLEKRFKSGAESLADKEHRILEQLQESADVIRVFSAREAAVLEYEHVREDLAAVLRVKGKFPEKIARKAFKQLASALEHAHSKGVCHMNLAPSALFFDSAHNLKIGNWERAESKDTPLQGCYGEPAFQCPEMLKGESFNADLADVWAFGVLLYMVVSGCAPFQGDSASLPDLIIKGKYAPLPAVSAEATDLINAILQRRISSIKQVRAHAWMMEARAAAGAKRPQQNLGEYMQTATMRDSSTPTTPTASLRPGGRPGARPGARQAQGGMASIRAAAGAGNMEPAAPAVVYSMRKGATYDEGMSTLRGASESGGQVGPRTVGPRAQVEEDDVPVPRKDSPRRKQGGSCCTIS